MVKLLSNEIRLRLAQFQMILPARATLKNWTELGELKHTWLHEVTLYNDDIIYKSQLLCYPV